MRHIIIAKSNIVQTRNEIPHTLHNEPADDTAEGQRKWEPAFSAACHSNWEKETIRCVREVDDVRADT